MSDGCASDTEHDAILRVFDTSDRLGRKIIGWRWSDRRPTMSHNEYEEATCVLIEKAEDSIEVFLEHYRGSYSSAV